MGESFVALPANQAALMYNPAGLAGLRGMTVSYSRKEMNWVSLTDDWSLKAFNAAVATPFGVFAAQYNRLFMGTHPVTTIQNPDGAGSEATIYSHDAALGFGTTLGRGVSVGVAAKYYDFVENFSGEMEGTVPTTPAYLFDFGITYTLPRFHAQTAIEDSVTVGTSFQNVGTSWKVKGAPANQSYSELPEYFRMGFSFAMRIVPGEKEDLTIFSSVLTAEFRSLQAHATPPVESSYWGIGLECTIFDFVSLRGGAAFRPLTTFEAEHDRAAFRYGAGLRLPLGRIGVDFPLAFSLQYAVIPLNQLEYYDLSSSVRSSVSAFSLDIQYTGAPW